MSGLAYSFLEGRTENVFMDEARQLGSLSSSVRGEVFSSEQVTTSSLPLIFLPHDLEISSDKTLAVGKMEFSKKRNFPHFGFHVRIILWKLSRHTL